MNKAIKIHCNTDISEHTHAHTQRYTQTCTGTQTSFGHTIKAKVIIIKKKTHTQIAAQIQVKTYGATYTKKTKH